MLPKCLVFSDINIFIRTWSGGLFLGAVFSSYSWFGNDLQVPESNSTALPDALIKIYAAKLGAL